MQHCSLGLITRSKIIPQYLYPIFALGPVIVYYFLNPAKFEIDWVGYSTFAYAYFFAVITWLVYTIASKPSNKINLKGVALSLTVISLYQFVVYGLGYSSEISQAGANLGIKGFWLTSWGVAIDLTFFAFYLIMLTISFYGVNSLKKLSPPIIYLFLTVSAILLDDFYPLASFTPFQVIVPFITTAVGNLLPLTGLSPRTFSVIDPKGQMRSFVVVNDPRFLAIEINWPCAGIFSVLIYFAVMLSLLQLVKSSKLRKTIYLTLGFLGTISVNILRISALIVSYVYLNADSIIFHQYVGGLFFVVWISLFLLTIFYVEKRRLHIGQEAAQVNLRIK